MANLIEHLKEREGVKYVSYLDSLDKLTGGVGHLLTPEEQKMYPKGTQIPKQVVDQWLHEDLTWAKKAAQQQAKSIDGATPELIDALVSVNFQLGENWHTVHKKTWEYLTTGKYNEASQEVFDSKWHQQTPKRTTDFSVAIKKFGQQKELINYNRQQTLTDDQIMGAFSGR